MSFGLVTNILVTAMLLTGGSAVVTSLTGMNTVAACFLLPLGVILYTMFGGIKATFLTDYVHTLMIIIILLFFAFTTYATSPILGSPSAVYDLLVQAAAAHPVEGNEGGSYLTMKSKEGAIFFVINITGAFGTVFCDNGYYNKAIAAHPVSALPGYIMGGLSWFAIPWLCATTMGLAAVALESNPAFPGFPLRMSSADVSAGLVLPNAAVALLGQGGAIATLLLVFMAVTSATSAELIAVSGIFTYDIYQTYFKPDATGKSLIYMAHCCVVGFGIFMAAFSTGLYYAGISMGYIYLMMGCIVSSAVLPAILTVMWKKQNRIAAAASPVLGLICGLIAWLVTAQKLYGSLDVDSTGSNYPMLAGNVASLLSPLVFIPLLTYAFGADDYDFVSMAMIRKGHDSDMVSAADADSETASNSASQEIAVRNELIEKAQEEDQMLAKASKVAKIVTVILTLVLLVLWPMPLYGTGYIFSRRFFTGWVSVGILWLFCSAACVGLFPLWQGRGTMARTFKALCLDITGKRKPRKHFQVTELVAEESRSTSHVTELVDEKQ